MDEDETYSTDGVECPACGKIARPDGEPGFYDESGFEMECPCCDAKLEVEPYQSWSWTTTLSKSKGDKS